MSLDYKPFLEHLKKCQGCTGERNPEICPYAHRCATAEVLFKKGKVRDSRELLRYGIKK